MDKKEILQRAQRENQDDGMAAAENRRQEIWLFGLLYTVHRGADIQRHL